MTKKLEFKDMTQEQAIKYFGKVMWEDMKATGCLSGITCEMNKKGEIVRNVRT